MYKKIADDNAVALGLQEELSITLCFDMSVQNGGLKRRKSRECSKRRLDKAKSDPTKFQKEMDAIKVALKKST